MPQTAHSVDDLGLHGDVNIAFVAARALSCSLSIVGPSQAVKLRNKPSAAAMHVGEVHARQPDQLLTHGVLLSAGEASPREAGQQLG